MIKLDARSLVGRRCGLGLVTGVAVDGLYRPMLHVDVDNCGWLRVTANEVRREFGQPVVDALNEEVLRRQAESGWAEPCRID